MMRDLRCGCVYCPFGDYFLFECPRHAAQRAMRETNKKKTPAAKKKPPPKKIKPRKSP